ncbi:hypothetical protein Dimus_012624 [Dionaea muscipula]
MFLVFAVSMRVLNAQVLSELIESVKTIWFVVEISTLQVCSSFLISRSELIPNLLPLNDSKLDCIYSLTSLIVEQLVAALVHFGTRLCLSCICGTISACTGARCHDWLIYVNDSGGWFATLKRRGIV